MSHAFRGTVSSMLSPLGLAHRSSWPTKATKPGLFSETEERAKNGDGRHGVCVCVCVCQNGTKDKRGRSLSRVSAPTPYLCSQVLYLPARRN